MNKDYYIEIIIKNIFKNKFSKNLMVKIFLIFFILMVFFSLYSTIQNYEKNGIEEDISYRTFFVGRNSDMTEEAAILDLKTIDHVIDVYSDSEYFTALKLANPKIEGEFFVYGSSLESLPKIKKGRVFDSEYEIICPSLFYPSTDIINDEKIFKDKIIDMDKLIGETLKASYTKVISFKNETYELEEQELSLKVVGTFQNNKTMIDENICYSSQNLVGLINKDIEENLDLSGQINSIMVRVDSIKNINEVIEELYLKGYDASQVLSFDPTFFNMINVICWTLFVLCIIFIVALFIFNNRKIYEEVKYEVRLLKTLGYTEKNINSIIYFKNTILISIPIIFLLILLGGFYILYRILLINNPFLFYKVPICFNWWSLLFIIIIILFFMFLTTIMLLKKLKRDIDENV